MFVSGKQRPQFPKGLKSTRAKEETKRTKKEKIWWKPVEDKHAEMEIVVTRMYEIRPWMENYVRSWKHQGSSVPFPEFLTQKFMELNFEAKNDVKEVAIHFCEFILALNEGSREASRYLKAENQVLEPLFEDKRQLFTMKSQHKGLESLKTLVQIYVMGCSIESPGLLFGSEEVSDVVGLFVANDLSEVVGLFVANDLSEVVGLFVANDLSEVVGLSVANDLPEVVGPSVESEERVELFDQFDEDELFELFDQSEEPSGESSFPFHAIDSLPKACPNTECSEVNKGTLQFSSTSPLSVAKNDDDVICPTTENKKRYGEVIDLTEKGKRQCVELIDLTED
jgi:hypothetical protein